MKKQSALTLLIATTLLAPSRSESPRPGQATGSLTGDVVVAVKHVDGGRATDYAIFVDAATESKPSNGQVDHVFRLQGSAETGGEPHALFAGARVAWAPGTVSVRDESGRKLTFTIHGEESGQSSAPDLAALAAGPAAWTIDGYGLAHTVGWDMELPDQGLSDDTYVHLFGVAGSSACEAGGPNSSSCSVSCGKFGCSGDCDDGHYACCKCGLLGPSCKCILETDDDQWDPHS